MADQLDDFATAYRSLVETTCEWRAYELDDPAAMADRVFAELRAAAATPTLRRLFRLVNQVVAETYQRQTDQRSLTQGLVQGLADTWRRPAAQADPGMAALSRLSYADGLLLRQVAWDDLSFAEMAEINGSDTAQQERRYARALAHFAAKLPPGTADDPAAIIRRLQPGTHRRWPATPTSLEVDVH